MAIQHKVSLGEFRLKSILIKLFNFLAFNFSCTYYNQWNIKKLGNARSNSFIFMWLRQLIWNQMFYFCVHFSLFIRVDPSIKSWEKKLYQRQIWVNCGTYVPVVFHIHLRNFTCFVQFIFALLHFSIIGRYLSQIGLIVKLIITVMYFQN